MSFLKWLLKEKEEVEQERQCVNEANRLRLLTKAVEEERRRKAVAQFDSEKEQLLKDIIRTCEKSARCGFTDVLYVNSCTYSSYDFKEKLADVLRKQGFYVKVELCGLRISWE